MTQPKATNILYLTQSKKHADELNTTGRANAGKFAGVVCALNFGARGSSDTIQPNETQKRHIITPEQVRKVEKLQENTESQKTTHQKSHSATKRQQAEQIPTDEQKRHTARNYKALYKRRTNGQKPTEKGLNLTFGVTLGENSLLSPAGIF